MSGRRGRRRSRCSSRGCGRCWRRFRTCRRRCWLSGSAGRVRFVVPGQREAAAAGASAGRSRRIGSSGLPGDAAQCDLWFPPRKIPLEDGTAKLLPVLVITAAHSRFVTGRMIPTRKTEDLLLGSWELIQQLGRVPRRLIWDNEPGIGRGQRRAEGVASFMGTLATRLVLLPPRDPESKGVVERRNGWFETSFMPGRTFASPARLQRPVHRLADAGEHAGSSAPSRRPGRSDRG